LKTTPSITALLKEEDEGQDNLMKEDDDDIIDGTDKDPKQQLNLKLNPSEFLNMKDSTDSREIRKVSSFMGIKADHSQSGAVEDPYSRRMTRGLTK
jgi:hypothetical protein